VLLLICICCRRSTEEEEEAKRISYFILFFSFIFFILVLWSEFSDGILPLLILHLNGSGLIRQRKDVWGHQRAKTEQNREALTYVATIGWVSISSS